MTYIVKRSASVSVEKLGSCAVEVERDLRVYADARVVVCEKHARGARPAQAPAPRRYCHLPSTNYNRVKCV